MAAPTATECTTFGNRLISGYPENPTAKSIGNQLLAFASSISPAPPIPPIDPVFRVINKTYEQVFGHAVRGTQGYWSNIEQYNRNGKIDLTVIPFVAPSNYRCLLNASNMSSQLSVAVCTAPGAYVRNAATIGRPTLGSLQWQTAGTAPFQLVPGTKYYLCLAGFNIPHFNTTGEFIPNREGLLWDQFMSQGQDI